MAEIPSGESSKKRSIDDLIEHITADLQSYEGQYILLGGPQSGGAAVWSPPPTPGLFYHQSMRPHDSNEMMMMDVGGGNFVNVVFSKPPPPQEYNQPVQFLYQQPQNLVQPHLIDYAQRNYNEGTTNGCLIENVVGNWAPNLNGTYSPFGGLPKDDGGHKSQSNSQTAPQQSAPIKKQRIVAEVKPMRPSYSDVLAKSPPLTPPPIVKQTSPKPVQISAPIKTDVPRQRQQSKNGVTPVIGGCTKGNSSALKRQSSSGSDDGGKPRERGCSERWSSLEDLVPPPAPLPKPPLLEEVARRRRKRRSSKSVSEKDDKQDAILSGEKISVKKTFVEDEDDEVIRRNISSQTSKPLLERSLSKPKPRDKEDRKVGSSKLERSANSSRGSSKNKRTQRTYKKRESNLGALWKKWQEQSSYYAILLMSWLFNLLWDVTAMSITLLIHLCGVVYEQTINWFSVARSRIVQLAKKWNWFGGKSQRFAKKLEVPPLPGSLTHNITLPTTGEEAMKRLLSCKGKDPYSILGVTSNCTDEEIKKYYKSQALLVHPDKNSQPGAEEAFKILVHAFDLIAEPEKRAAYDRYVAETNQVEQAWSELSDLISQLHEKMEYAANTIRCNNCGKRHKREVTERPSYAARYCAQCKIHHAAKEGDMWAESRGWGWGCRYYACMGGSVYDITQWAHCQGGGVQRVKPDAHSVQYRVLLGRQQPPQPEPDFEDLLNSLYTQNGPGKRGKKRNKKSK